MDENGIPHKKSAQVPAQFAGYSLQPTRFLHRLLEADAGTIVSLEVFDDVGVETASGEKIAEQDKNFRSTNNPVSDRAVELWKTLYNWLRMVESGELDVVRTTFIIYVSTDHTGKIVSDFASARNKDEAKDAFSKALIILTRDKKDPSVATPLSESIETYVEYLLAANQDLVCSLIGNFSLISGSGSPIQDVDRLVRRMLIPDEIVDDVVKYSHGWVKTEIDQQIEKGLPAYVTRDEFHTQITSFVDRIRSRSLLRTFAQKPSDELVEEEVRFRTYVRQLELVNCDLSEKMRAVSDYLRASADRAVWSEKGLVNKDSFTEFEEKLERVWKNKKDENEINLRDMEEGQRGKSLYSKCMLYECNLEGMEPPHHFVPGSLHALADEEVIGWHPDYKKKLTKTRSATNK